MSLFDTQIDAVNWMKSNLKKEESLIVTINDSPRKIKFWRDKDNRLCWYTLRDPVLDEIVKLITGQVPK